jgi:hypothetical protein
MVDPTLPPLIDPPRLDLLLASRWTAGVRLAGPALVLARIRRLLLSAVRRERAWLAIGSSSAEERITGSD